MLDPPPYSTLGHHKDNGWVLHIYPPLTEDQWDQYRKVADATYDPDIENFSIDRARAFLARLFPGHRVEEV